MTDQFSMAQMCKNIVGGTSNFKNYQNFILFVVFSEHNNNTKEAHT